MWISSVKTLSLKILGMFTLFLLCLFNKFSMDKINFILEKTRPFEEEEKLWPGYEAKDNGYLC